jgi:hypothetical protein
MSNQVVLAMLNSVNAQLNEGLGPAIVNIYTGGPPAECEAPDTGTLIGTCVMSATPFEAATDEVPGGRLVANVISPETNADAAGTAGYFRIYSSDGGTNASKLNCHFQGTAGETADTTDLTLDVKVIALGGTIQVTSLFIDLPET